VSVCPRSRFLGESPHNGRALLASASDEQRSAEEEAEEFLREEFADEARHPADIFKAARKVGIADRTLRRARKKLGAETEKAGFGRGWEWWLPKGPTPLAPSQDEDACPFAKPRYPCGISRVSRHHSGHSGRPARLRDPTSGSGSACAVGARGGAFCASLSDRRG
jgi:hypothetical protein